MVDTSALSYEERERISILTEIITKALSNNKKGNSKDYLQILTQLKEQVSSIGTKKAPSAATLTLWFIAMSRCVSDISPEEKQIVSHSLDLLDFFTFQEDSFFSSSRDFVLNLVSARSIYVATCFSALVPLLLPFRNTVIAADHSLDRATARAHNNVLSLLHSIVKLVPSSPSEFFNVLERNFPHKLHSLTHHRVYVSNLLSIASTLSPLKEKILALIIDKLILLDVSIKLEEIIDESDSESEAEEDLFHVEITGPKPPAEEKPVDEADEGQYSIIATKLDYCMDLLLSYIRATASQSVQACGEVLNHILSIFDKSILSTYQSKYVQFTIFYVCSLREDFSEYFLGYLTYKILNPQEPSLKRQACLSYLASFVSRSSFIPSQCLVSTVSVLVEYVHNYLDTNEMETSFFDVPSHPLFYTACQALFYIFCFKHTYILDLDNGLSFLQQWRLDRILLSRFNPIKACVPNIVREFTRAVALRAEELGGLEEIVDAALAKTVSTHVSSSSNLQSNTLSSVNELDSFFPFDPYLLSVSSRHIAPIYCIWEPYTGGADDDDGMVLSTPSQSYSFSYGNSFGAVPRHTPQDGSGGGGVLSQSMEMGLSEMQRQLLWHSSHTGGSDPVPARAKTGSRQENAALLATSPLIEKGFGVSPTMHMDTLRRGFQSSVSPGAPLLRTNAHLFLSPHASPS
eukprot:GCRY01000619.1.p1 GENE.GCRY01000619.1~~GCRY01000619.1.p1  ORF type:complete len:687 (+),score=131.40 GCRY01000619.1:234-2294(+)